jgi:hypothetical protein
MESDLAYHTINEGKLAKLHSILNVLRDKEDAGGSSDSPDASQEQDQQDQPRKPEFLRVFDKTDPADVSSMTLPSNRRRKRRNRLSKAVLRVLHEDSPDLSSDSGDNLDDGPLSSSLNKQSMAWIRSRRLESQGEGSGRPRSDSFQSIPKLRESLNAGNVSKVSTYAFDSPKRKSTPMLDVGERGNVSGDRSHVTSKGDPRHSYDGSKQNGETQLHYKVMDNRPQPDDDSPSQQDAKYASPVCKHYSVPVEVSLHRISIKDVDEPSKTDVGRTYSCGVQARQKKSVGHPSILPSHVLAEQDKPRPRSLGDMDMLGSDDELLLVRAPVPSRNRRSVVVSPGGVMEMSSLDFTSKGAGRSSLPVTSSYFAADGGEKQRLSYKGEVATRTWLKRISRADNMSKCHSLDDLLEAVPKKPIAK